MEWVPLVALSISFAGVVVSLMAARGTVSRAKEAQRREAEVEARRRAQWEAQVEGKIGTVLADCEHCRNRISAQLDKGTERMTRIEAKLGEVSESIARMEGFLKLLNRVAFDDLDRAGKG